MYINVYQSRSMYINVYQCISIQCVSMCVTVLVGFFVSISLGLAASKPQMVQEFILRILIYGISQHLLVVSQSRF